LYLFIYMKNYQSWTGSGFGGEISGSGKKVRIRIRNTRFNILI
jgi:hypothetical protein